VRVAFLGATYSLLVEPTASHPLRFPAMKPFSPYYQVHSTAQNQIRSVQSEGQAQENC